MPRGGIELSPIGLKLRHFSNDDFLVYPLMYPAFRTIWQRQKPFVYVRCAHFNGQFWPKPCSVSSIVALRRQRPHVRIVSAAPVCTRHANRRQGVPIRRGPCRFYAADLRPRVRGGAISASAGMSYSRCSFQAILIVRARFLVRMSDARWREPSRQPRSAWL